MTTVGEAGGLWGELLCVLKATVSDVGKASFPEGGGSNVTTCVIILKNKGKYQGIHVSTI